MGTDQKITQKSKSAISEQTAFFQKESLHNSLLSVPKTMALKQAIADFENYYIPEPNTGCWLWNKTFASLGYGQLGFQRKHYHAHRFSYLLHVGPIPRGLCVCHRCDTPACVNPAHLFLSTRSGNILDCVFKGRWKQSKITPEQAIAIYHDPRLHVVIAADYGIAHNTVSDIKRGTIRKWIQNSKPNFTPNQNNFQQFKNLEVLEIKSGFKPRGKFTPEQILFIRHSKMRGIDLAKKFGVNKSVISQIIHRKRQGWVQDLQEGAA